MSIHETKPRHGGPPEAAATWTSQLTVVYPPRCAARHRLTAATVVLGRDPPDDGLRIDDDTVSRRHLELRWEPASARHLAVDLGSSNGSARDARPLTAMPTLLADNCLLRLGDVLAVYERAPGQIVDAPAVDHAAIPGDSLAIAALRELVARVAVDPSPAVLIGESGSGKERIVGELHRLSGRPGPLVTVNCAAISPQLVESSLFGHERGAFTGAASARQGFFRAAHGGTLFLDEVGELPLELQPKLLRAIEGGEVIAVGSTTTQHVDVRVIAATNRDLAGEVARGRFRRDLYARLALWELQVPPLRQRRSDLLAWVDRFVARWAEQRGLADAPALELSLDAATALLLSDWPENLRGLHRLVHELVHRAGTGPIGHHLLPGFIAAAELPNPTPLPRAPRPSPSRDELLAILTANGHSIRATARHFDRDRKQITRWIARYGIVLPSRPGGDEE